MMKLEIDSEFCMQNSHTSPALISASFFLLGITANETQFHFIVRAKSSCYHQNIGPDRSWRANANTKRQPMARAQSDGPSEWSSLIA